MATGYTKSINNLMRGNIPLISGAIKFALCQNAYVPDQDLHEFFSDLTNEVVGNGYPAGGVLLANKAIVEEAANNRAYFDNTADIVFNAVGTITARFGILYHDTTNPATSPLISYQDFGSDVTATNAALTFSPDANGMWRISIV